MTEEVIQPYDDVIPRLEKQLARQKDKLDKKPSHNNKLQYGRIKNMLDNWKEQREVEVKKRKRDADSTQESGS